jgi:hypothetical protein
MSINRKAAVVPRLVMGVYSQIRLGDVMEFQGVRSVITAVHPTVRKLPELDCYRGLGESKTNARFARVGQADDIVVD